MRIVSPVAAIQQITIVHNSACIGKSEREYINIDDTREITPDWRPKNWGITHFKIYQDYHKGHNDIDKLIEDTATAILKRLGE